MAAISYQKQNTFERKYVIIIVSNHVALSNLTDPEQIAMLEPLGVAHNIIDRLNVKGQDILVIGSGPVGLMAQAAAKALGAKR